MKTTVKHVSDTKVLLTITVGKEELEAAEHVALSKLSKNIKVPGFRKGHVPANVAAKHVDPNALGQQMLDDALSKAVAEAFVTEKIQALDRPQVEVKKFVPGQELEFTAETEILPVVKLGNYKKLGIKKEVAAVTAKDVDEIIERIQQGLAERKTVERAAKDGDEVVVDFVGKKDGVAFDGGAAKDYTLKLGSNQFVPGFEEKIVGHKAGEEFDIDVKFPKDYHSKELAGAKVVFSVTLKEVKEIVLPAVDDELAKKAGPFTTAKEMKDDIKREITVQKEREATEKLKDKLVEKLVEISTVPAPEILIQDQSRSIEQDMMQNLAYQGLTIESYLTTQKLTHDEWINGEVREAALYRVQSGLALAELSKQEEIKATSEELAIKTAEYQVQFGKKSGQDFTSPEQQQALANRLLTEKTLDRLVELNK